MSSAVVPFADESHEWAYHCATAWKSPCGSPAYAILATIVW